MPKKPSVTIAIPAYNEEQNIGVLLTSVLIQEETLFTIDKILVISDGSDDRTIDIVSSFNDPRLELMAYSIRTGKSKHLNTIFKQTMSDFLVLFDADVQLMYPTVLHHLITPLIRHTEVMLVGGNPQPKPGKTFVEKSINLSFEAYDKLRLLHDAGHNAFGCDGRILALRRSFYQSIHVPHDMIANDAFMYFSCIAGGGGFRHARLAKVWYRSPATIADHLKQNKRFLGARKRLAGIFGPIVDEAYTVSIGLKLKLFLPRLFSKPLHAVAIYVINWYCMVKGNIEEHMMSAVWPMAESTKRKVA